MTRPTSEPAPADAIAEIVLIRLAMEVRARRARLAITQQQLAERSALHRSHVSAVECACCNLSLRSLARLADGLGMDLDIKLIPRDSESG